MEALIESVRAAGAAACRAILGALEPVPLASSPAPSPPQAPQIAAIAAALRGMPPDQLLDLAIDRLRAKLPAGAELPATQPIKFQPIIVGRKG